MSNPLQNPAVHYGMGLTSAAILLAVAFLFLDGTMQYLVAGMAALEIVVVPQILRRAGEQAETADAV